MPKYRNIDLIQKIDDLHDKILSEANRNKYRDHFFPKLIDELGLKVGCEIGVDKGGFSHHLLSKTDLKCFYCVDPWIDDFGSDHQPGYFNKNGNKRMQEAKDTLSDIDKSRYHMLRMTGREAAKTFKDESLDYVYIDGDHSLKGVFEDLYGFAPKVRVGGIISGHDYKNGPKSGMTNWEGKQLDYNVKTVVDEFCYRYGYKLKTVGGKILSWYFVKV